LICFFVIMSSNTKKLSRFDMVQFEFSDENLDMSFLYDYVSRAHKEDPMIKVLTEDIYFEGEKCSNICMIDPSNDTLHVGMAEAGSMPYRLHHDFAGVNAIFSFCQDNRYMYGNVPFPDVPVAKSPFPPNQYYRPCGGYDLEYILCRKGFRLLNVTVGCYKEMSNSFPVYTSEGLVGMELKDNEGFYFTPYMDNMIDKNVLGMQFNPFHPMAIKMLKTAEWSGNVLKGTYEYRSHIIPFSYDLEDRRYRIYSEDWRQILPEVSGFLEVFDFVAFFPMNDLLNLKERKYHVEPFVVEPLIISSSFISYPYSKIGPTLISVFRGVGDIVNVPYSRFEMESPFSSVCYEEITSFCKLYVGDRLEYDGRVINFRKDVLQSDTIFVRVVCRDDEFRFRAFRACSKGSFHFLEVPNIYFNSFPRNVWGSIIYPYNCQTLIDIYKCGDSVHEFLPMYVSIDDSLDFNYECDDIPIEDDKMKIDVDCIDRSTFFFFIKVVLLSSLIIILLFVKYVRRLSILTMLNLILIRKFLVGFIKSVGCVIVVKLIKFIIMLILIDFSVTLLINVLIYVNVISVRSMWIILVSFLSIMFIVSVSIVLVGYMLNLLLLELV